MKKPVLKTKHPVKTPAKKAPARKTGNEPLPEGYIQEPHSDYGTLNDELNFEKDKK